VPNGLAWPDPASLRAAEVMRDMVVGQVGGSVDE
jgi:hypothetical protein